MNHSQHQRQWGPPQQPTPDITTIPDAALWLELVRRTRSASAGYWMPTIHRRDAWRIIELVRP